jgi:hypothetical protein
MKGFNYMVKNIIFGFDEEIIDCRTNDELTPEELKERYGGIGINIDVYDKIKHIEHEPEKLKQKKRGENMDSMMANSKLDYFFNEVLKNSKELKEYRDAWNEIKYVFDNPFIYPETYMIRKCLPMLVYDENIKAPGSVY